MLLERQVNERKNVILERDEDLFLLAEAKVSLLDTSCLIDLLMFPNSIVFVLQAGQFYFLCDLCAYATVHVDLFSS